MAKVVRCVMSKEKLAELRAKVLKAEMHQQVPASSASLVEAMKKAVRS